MAHNANQAFPRRTFAAPYPAQTIYAGSLSGRGRPSMDELRLQESARQFDASQGYQNEALALQDRLVRDQMALEQANRRENISLAAMDAERQRALAAEAAGLQRLAAIRARRSADPSATIARYVAATAGANLNNGLAGSQAAGTGADVRGASDSALARALSAVLGITGGRVSPGPTLNNEGFGGDLAALAQYLKRGR